MMKETSAMGKNRFQIDRTRQLKFYLHIIIKSQAVFDTTLRNLRCINDVHRARRSRYYNGLDITCRRCYTCAPAWLNNVARSSLICSMERRRTNPVETRCTEFKREDSTEVQADS